MKIGDLVTLKQKTIQPEHIPRYGIIVNCWTNHKRQLQGIDIMHGKENKVNCLSPHLYEVINEAR